MINNSNNTKHRTKPKDPLHPPISIPIFPLTPSGANTFLGSPNATAKFSKVLPKPCPETLTRKHRRIPTDLNAKLHNICNIYSSLLSPPGSSLHQVKFPVSPKVPSTFTSFRGSQGSIRTTQGTPRGETRTSSRAGHERKPSLKVGSKLVKKPDSATRPRGASSALAIKHPIMGSFVSSKGNLVEDKDKSVNPQAALNVKSMSYGRPELTTAKKLIKVPVKLRLKSKAKQPSAPTHIRSMSDVVNLSNTNTNNINKGLQQTIKKDGIRIVTTPTNNSSGGFHFGKDEKMKEYKKAITVATSINSMRVKVARQFKPEAETTNKVIRVHEPRLASSQSVGSKLTIKAGMELDTDEDTLVPKQIGKKNKFEQTRDALIKWINDCIISTIITDIDKKIHKSHPSTTIDFYIVGRVLGKGAFGKVNLCLHKLSGKLIAMKSLHKQYLASDHNKAKFQNEIALLRVLKHKSIIRLYETFSSGNLLLIVLELCGGGDLLTYVRKRKRLSEPVAKVAFKQILEGLQHCHSKGIVHRDIKLDNILLNEVGDIKICDFGVSKQVNKGQRLKDRCGTPAYIAPEILKEIPYDGTLADIWSAGVVLYAMLYGNFPFRAENVDELEELVIAGKFSLSDTVSVEGRKLISKILMQEPSLRPSIEEILADPWMQDIDETILLFTEEEIQAIKNEYNFKDRLVDDNSDASVFTEHNLDTTENADDNHGIDISKSLILAPFNSLVQQEDELIDAVKDLVIDKKVIKFRSKLREFDRRYERDNNSKLDNGVYVQGANKAPESKPVAKNEDKNETRKDKGRQQGLGRVSKNIVTKSHPATTSYIDRTILKKMEGMGYDKSFIIASLSNNDLNSATTLYYLMAEKDKLIP